ncbi:uncharacterized protein YaiL-like [Nilaparvata lugens]|uniref:uncharacterized protein YaiL-like n=1 Tax=Nilaparvata lugens TaxID=108931 RepID=UPI00193DDCD4|nr:uncharacterized protein YaiL-like [Nilaparvata lugens]
MANAKERLKITRSAKKQAALSKNTGAGEAADRDDPHRPGKGDIGFNFTDGNLIKKILVDKATQTQLIHGRLAIARLVVENREECEYAIIPASVADKIAQRDAAALCCTAR